jgi:hypothetical protein
VSGAVQYQRQPEQGLKIPATLDLRSRPFRHFTPEELKALNVERSEVINLEKSVPRRDLDPHPRA